MKQVSFFSVALLFCLTASVGARALAEAEAEADANPVRICNNKHVH